MLQPGQRIDEKYRIIRLIGEGGMGAVYEAEHAFLERRVAIKVLASGMAESAEAIRRFYYNVIAAPIPPPRSRRAEVSAELDAVVMRAMQRDPAARFATADAFAEALEMAWLSVGESGFVLEARGDDRGSGIGEEETAVAPHAMPPAPTGPAPLVAATAAPAIGPRRPAGLVPAAGPRAAPQPPTAEPQPARAPAVSGRSATTTAGRPASVWARVGARPIAGALVAALVVIGVALTFVFVGRGTAGDGRPASVSAAADAGGVVPPPPVGGGGLIRIRRDAGGQP